MYKAPLRNRRFAFFTSNSYNILLQGRYYANCMRRGRYMGLREVKDSS